MAPTPQSIVDKMLEVAKVTKDDYVFDLGSGDGRIPITAAKRYGARGFGVDINPKLVAEARDNAKLAGVSDRVEFRRQDLFQTSVREATVVRLLSVRLGQRQTPPAPDQRAASGQPHCRA